MTLAHRLALAAHPIGLIEGRLSQRNLRWP